MYSLSKKNTTGFSTNQTQKQLIKQRKNYSYLNTLFYFLQSHSNRVRYYLTKLKVGNQQFDFQDTAVRPVYEQYFMALQFIIRPGTFEIRIALKNEKEHVTNKMIDQIIIIDLFFFSFQICENEF